MTDAAVPDRPGFHLVDPSPWPLVGAAFGFLTAFGLILFMHGASLGSGLLTVGIAGILFTMAGWWRDVVSEAQGGYHNIIVRHGLTFGMILFIASEVMFFVAWFWAFFWNALNPADPQTYGLLDFSGGIWPPKGTEVINPLALPLMNTFVLLTSSAAVNVALVAKFSSSRLLTVRTAVATGVILLGIVQDILDLANVSNYWIEAIDGAVILFALFLARIVGGESTAED